MEEVNSVVKAYYEVIEKKDEDIFELFRDNNRLQKQLNETLTSEEDREAELRILKLLVGALQIELKEKQLIVQEHEKERTTMQAAITRGREVLNMDSELNYTAGDVVNKFIAYYKMCHELQCHLEVFVRVAAANCCAMQLMIIDAEERERHIINQSCDGIYHVVVSLSQCARAAVVERESLQTRSEAARRELLHEVKALRDQLASEQQEQRRRVEMWQEKASAADVHLRLCQRQAEHEREEKEFLLEEGCARLDLMAEAYAGLGRVLAASARACQHYDGKLQEACKKVADVGKRNEKMQTSLSQARARLRALQKPESVPVASSGVLGKREGKDATNRECSIVTNPRQMALVSVEQSADDPLTALQEEHAALKAEWRKSLERERAVRQELVLVTNRSKSERDVHEAAIKESQQRCAALTDDAQRLQREVKQYAKQAKELRRLLYEAKVDLESSEKKCRNLEEVNQSLKERCAELEGCAEREREARIAQERQLREQVRLMEEQCVEQGRSFQCQIEALERQLHGDKEGFLTELKAWTGILDEAQRKIAAAESDRDKEKMLRCMIAEQHQDETRIIRNVMTEEKAVATNELQCKVKRLELVCKRSAKVIAELREALHRAKAANVASVSG
uniref:Uncharacterized protein TCIL3000_11_9070 n=1 Tax=Trypanosoma congolense (strain IL3000) TaxID=1068625 RepID=G0V1C8_TRYCI|nr:unnamed protein product [Trypanosoma congolense IL3000]